MYGGFKIQGSFPVSKLVNNVKWIAWCLQFCDASYSVMLLLCLHLGKKGVIIIVLFSAPFGCLIGKMLLSCRKSIVLVFPLLLQCQDASWNLPVACM